MSVNVVDLGLDIENTKDIPHIEYWTPEFTVVESVEMSGIMFIIRMIDNSHREIFKNAINEGERIKVSGAVGKNPSFWLSVKDHTIIIDAAQYSIEGDKFKNKRIKFYFTDVDDNDIGQITIRT